jgi:hypothetical protein
MKTAPYQGVGTEGTILEGGQSSLDLRTMCQVDLKVKTT